MDYEAEINKNKDLIEKLEDRAKVLSPESLGHYNIRRAIRKIEAINEHLNSCDFLTKNYLQDFY